MPKRLVLGLFEVAAINMFLLVATQGAFFEGAYYASAFGPFALKKLPVRQTRPLRSRTFAPGSILLLPAALSTKSIYLPSIISSIFGLRCPKCRRGDLFATSSFSFNKPFEQYEYCPKCGEDYFPEPGFYYGAMFISYIGSGFFCLGFVMLLHWVFGWSTLASFGLLVAVVGLCFVWWFRFSRSAYFHLIVGHDPQVTTAVDKGELEIKMPNTTSQN